MKLVLKKESLVELSTDELVLVHAGAVPWTPWCPLILELTDQLSEIAC